MSGPRKPSFIEGDESFGARIEFSNSTASGISEMISARFSDLEKAELDEWRTGKRRVFWRVRWTVREFGYCFDYPSRNAALGKCYRIRGYRPKLYRVTVRPKGRP